MSVFSEKKSFGKSKKILKAVFNNWKRFSFIRRYIKEKNKQRIIRAQINMFYELRDHAVLCNKIKQFKEERNERNLKRSIITWKQYLHKRAKKHHQQVNFILTKGVYGD